MFNKDLGIPEPNAFKMYNVTFLTYVTILTSSGIINQSVLPIALFHEAQRYWNYVLQASQLENEEGYVDNLSNIQN